MLDRYQGTQISRSQGAQNCVCLGDLEMERHRLQLSTLGGTGKGRTEVRHSHPQSLSSSGGSESSTPRLSLDTQNKVMLPAVPKQGWTGEGADELKVRSCSLSLS